MTTDREVLNAKEYGFFLEITLADQPDLIKPFQSLNYREDSLFKSIMGYGSVQKGNGFEFLDWVTG